MRHVDVSQRHSRRVVCAAHQGRETRTLLFSSLLFIQNALMCHMYRWVPVNLKKKHQVKFFRVNQFFESGQMSIAEMGV